jgi:hypothetical protein
VSLLLATVRCHYCSKWLPIWLAHRLGSPDRPAQTICENCLDWHQRAIDLLAGNAISGCQACGATWATLRDRPQGGPPGADVRLYVVPRDGVYQVLCKTCVAPYVAKRGDLYRGTAFARRA